MSGSEKVCLVVVVPCDLAEGFVADGYSAGRCNRYTTTVSKVFSSLRAASRVAERLGFIWAVESAA